MSRFGGAGIPLSAREGSGPRMDSIDPSNSAISGASLTEEQLLILSSFQVGREGRSQNISAPQEGGRAVSYQGDRHGRVYVPRAPPAEEHSSSFQFDPGGGGDEASGASLASAELFVACLHFLGAIPRVGTPDRLCCSVCGRASTWHGLRIFRTKSAALGCAFPY